MAETAVYQYADALHERQEAVDAWLAHPHHHPRHPHPHLAAGGPGSPQRPPPIPLPPPAPLAVASKCMGDVLVLWPALAFMQQRAQLPLVMALAANVLAFSTQTLEETDQLRGGGSRTRVRFGDAHPHNPSAAACAAVGDSFSAAAGLMAFLFPMGSVTAVPGDPLRYAPREWPRVSVQAAGSLGALEMALRSRFTPSPGIQSVLLHATAGAGVLLNGFIWYRYLMWLFAYLQYMLRTSNVHLLNFQNDSKGFGLSVGTCKTWLH